MLPLRNRYLQYGNRQNGQDIFCPFCKNLPETEVHFLLICQKYTDLRNEFISRKYFGRPSLFKMALLLSNSNTNVIFRTAIFVYKAFARRMDSLSALRSD